MGKTNGKTNGEEVERCRACEHMVAAMVVPSDRGIPVEVCPWCFAPLSVRYWPWITDAYWTFLDLGEGRAWNVGPRAVAMDNPNVDWDEANAIARETAR